MIVEAYRHLVDPLEDDADRAAILATVRPRVLVTCDVDVSMLLDLRTPGARNTAGLTISELASPTDAEGAYLRCQRVAQIAHQLGRHGIIAPAATGLGDTLALFTDLLPTNERPVFVAGAEEHWSTLPDDPRIASLSERHLHVVGDDRPHERRPRPQRSCARVAVEGTACTPGPAREVLEALLPGGCGTDRRVMIRDSARAVCPPPHRCGQVLAYGQARSAGPMRSRTERSSIPYA